MLESCGSEATTGSNGEMCLWIASWAMERGVGGYVEQGRSGDSIAAVTIAATSEGVRNWLNAAEGGRRQRAANAALQ